MAFFNQLTGLLLVLKQLLLKYAMLDTKCDVVLLLFGLTAVCDTVNQNLLLTKLSENSGLAENALEWFFHLILKISKVITLKGLKVCYHLGLKLNQSSLKYLF